MNLTQQLEDKKKEVYNSDIWKEIIDAGIEEKTEIEYKKMLNVKVGSKEYNELDDETKAILISIKKAEIAILEQAISEIEKQRQEILNKIDKIFIEHYTDNLEEVPYQSSEYNRAEEVYEELKQQLNQPKTEQ